MRFQGYLSMAKLKVFRGTGHFDRARAVATPDQVVCGCVLTDGSGAAFLMPADCSALEMSDAAFAIRHGRPPAQAERHLLQMADRLRSKGLCE